MIIPLHNILNNIYQIKYHIIAQDYMVDKMAIHPLINKTIYHLINYQIMTLEH
jgi:hypothetical protein